MRMITLQHNLPARVLKIVLATGVTAASLYCGTLAMGQTPASTSPANADIW